MKQHVASIRTNIVVFVALLVLLLATVGAAYLPMGAAAFSGRDGDRRGQGRLDRAVFHARACTAIGSRW